MVIKLVNFILFIIVVSLIITLSIQPNPIKNFVKQDILTNFYFKLDTSEPKCYFSKSEGNINEILDVNRCCYELQKQLICKKIENNHVIKGSDIECYTSLNSWKYFVNSKTFNYCIIEGYDVKKTE